MFKLTLTVVLALQVSGSIIPFDLYDEAYILLEDLKDSVNVSYNTASNRLSVHERETITSVNTLQTVGNAQADTDYLAIQQQLQALKTQYADNTNLETCLEGRESLLPDLQQTVKDHLLVCVVENSDNIRFYLNRAVNDLNAINNRVAGVETTLTSCGRDDVVCIAGIIGQVPDLQNTLPRQIIQTANNATLQMDNALFELERCTIRDVSSVITLGDRILDEIRLCITSA